MPERLAYQLGQRMEVQALGGVSVAVGLSILVGGHARFDHAPSFYVARQVPGGYLTWGLLALGIGAFTLAASHRWRHRLNVMVGLAAQTVLFMFWTISILFSDLQDQHAPYTGVAIYGGYTVLCAIAYTVGVDLERIERQRQQVLQ